MRQKKVVEKLFFCTSKKHNRHSSQIFSKSPQKNVCDATKRYKEIGSIKDRPKSGRPIIVSSPKNRELIRKRIYRNFHQSNQNR